MNTGSGQITTASIVVYGFTCSL